MAQPDDREASSAAGKQDAGKLPRRRLSRAGDGRPERCSAFLLLLRLSVLLELHVLPGLLILLATLQVLATLHIRTASAHLLLALRPLLQQRLAHLTQRLARFIGILLIERLLNPVEGAFQSGMLVLDEVADAVEKLLGTILIIVTQRLPDLLERFADLLPILHPPALITELTGAPVLLAVLLLARLAVLLLSASPVLLAVLLLAGLTELLSASPVLLAVLLLAGLTELLSAPPVLLAVLLLAGLAVLLAALPVPLAILLLAGLAVLLAVLLLTGAPVLLPRLLPGAPVLLAVLLVLLTILLAAPPVLRGRCGAERRHADPRQESDHRRRNPSPCHQRSLRFGCPRIVTPPLAEARRSRVIDANAHRFARFQRATTFIARPAAGGYTSAAGSSLLPTNEGRV